MRQFRRLIAVLIAAALAPVSLLAQEAATVTGRVTNAQGQPEAAVLVRIESLNAGASTGADGSYRLVIPGARIRAGQSVQITASRQGLASVSRSITLSPGANLTQNFQMTAQIILLEDVVVTGTAGAVEVAKLPFTVGRVDAADLQVPAVSAGGAIQGKVAGAQVVSPSGLPGQAPSILLRGPKSINSAGRSQEPLYIVDGVILAGGMQDIDSNDIESVEVVKGAAASSLYGARAAYGVVQITTRSGRRMESNSTQYRVRTEYGQSTLPDEISIAQNHAYKMNAAGTRFLAADGTEIDYQAEAIKRSNRLPACGGAGSTNCYRAPAPAGTNEWSRYQTGQWPNGVVDQVERFFTNGAFSQTTLSASGNQGNTNYHASFSNLDQEGLIEGLNGFTRRSFRLNLDQGLGETLTGSFRGFYSTAQQDGQNLAGSGSILFDLTRMPGGVDLNARDEDGDPIIAPDLYSENENPLYQINAVERSDDRERFLGGVTLRWSPLSWFELEGNGSYDRSTVNQYRYWFPGFKTVRADANLNNGQYRRDNWSDEAFNASATATLRRGFGDLNTTTQFRYLYEEADYDFFRASATDLVVGGVPDLDAGSDNQIVRSTQEEIRSEGWYAITNLDFRDRYILDALVRRDGSSLFGENERWQSYYRLAGAWRVSEESWWPLTSSVEQFKLHYALGTSGGRPNFYAQYETFGLTDGVLAGGVTLGNKDLKPELATEREFGLSALLFGRVSLDVTRALSTIEDQILQVPLPAATGFGSQWRNAGTLKSNTWEVALQADVLQRGSFSWNTRVLYDRTRQKITQLDVPAFQFGDPNTQGLTSVFYAREGEVYGTFYGTRWATQCSDLPSDLQSQCGAFDVNSDGYFVYVGQGNTAQSAAGADGALGTADDLWGTTAPFTLRGATVRWGTPLIGQDADGSTFQPLGNTLPDYNLSFGNTFTMGPVSLYAQVDATQGVEVYNLPRHWAYFEQYHGDQDQDPNDPDRKPQGYYSALYSALEPPNSHFVEDGSFVKLRELSLRWTLGDRALGGLPGLNGGERLTLSLVGRNLFSIDDYTGYDPEVGNTASTAGSAAIARFDGFNYPNMRTITAAVELSF